MSPTVRELPRVFTGTVVVSVLCLLFPVPGACAGGSGPSPAPTTVAAPGAALGPRAVGSAFVAALTTGTTGAVRARTTTRIVPDDVEAQEYAQSFGVQVCVRSTGRIPNGQVELRLDGTRRSTMLLEPDGCTELWAPAANIGRHLLRIDYAGTRTFAPSRDTARFQVVQSRRMIDLPEEPLTVRVGAPVTITGHLRSPLRAPGGHLIVREDDRWRGTARVVGGTARVRITGLAVGRHSLDLTYTGDSWFTETTTTLVVYVLPEDSSPLLLHGPPEKDLPVLSGSPVEVELATLLPLDGVVGVQLVDSLRDSVLGYSPGTGPHTWSLSENRADRRLQARAVDAAGKVLHRSQILHVSWEPPQITLRASPSEAQTGQPVTLRSEVPCECPEPLCSCFDSETYGIRIAEVPEAANPDNRIPLIDCDAWESCSIDAVNTAGTRLYVAELVARDVQAVISRSGTIAVRWS
ncbi:MAG: 5-nucleotidase [Actinomycetota bacterium]|nr:5-nucleotidase [Actinomycetota bacterium]